MEHRALININRKTIKVKHSELKRADRNSIYRSRCPACKEGVLLVQRDQDDNFALLNVDRCILCGQRFIYEKGSMPKRNSLFH